MIKNTASQQFHVIAFDVDGRVSGEALNITCQLSIDGGARASTGDVNPTEIGVTGEYIFDLTQAETNGHALSFTPVCVTDGVQVLGVPSNVIYTSAVNSGTGYFLIKLTLKTSLGVEIPYCDVVLTESSVGDSVEVHSRGFSGSTGRVEFTVLPGTYYLWRNKDQYSFTDPLTLVVDNVGVLTVI